MSDPRQDLADELARVLAPELPIVPWEMGTSAIRVAHAKRKSFALWVIAALAALAVGLCVLVINEAIKGSRAPAEQEAAARLPAQTAEAPRAPDPAPVTTSGAPLGSSAEPLVSASSAGSASAAPSSSQSAKPRPKGGYNRWGL